MKQQLQSSIHISKGVCNVCEKNTFVKCRMCGLHFHFQDNCIVNSVSCSADLHMEKFFGSVKCDRKNMFGGNVEVLQKHDSGRGAQNTMHPKHT